MNRLGTVLLAGMMAWSTAKAAETCTTQSQMKPAERDALALAAQTLAEKIQANDQSAVRTSTIADFQKDFTAMGGVISTTAPKLKGTVAQVEQVYLLDASTLTKTADGSNPDAQFFCSLNHSQNATEFSIPQLPPGRYGFAMVRMDGATPWRLSFLLRQDQGQWRLAGLYPKALTVGGHDGLWFWNEARNQLAAKAPWTSWLYFQEAQSLLLPAVFVSSTHLDKLQAELSSAAPPAVSSGLGPDAPLVVKGADGQEFRFTAITVDDTLSGDKPDVAAHLKVDALTDAVAARKRNVDAMTALLAAHPELRKSFHGVWVFAEAPGQTAYATQLAMAEIR
jgi:hypothetical protein